ncbi:MAG: MopE-related protein, partial [Chitinophagales bacterium]
MKTKINKLSTIITANCLLLTANCFSQEPFIQWQNVIGGTGSDLGKSIHQTADGGYIIGGDSYSGIGGDKTEPNVSGGTATLDFWIVKTDAAGNILWQNTIGGTMGDEFVELNMTSDGGYIFGGTSYSGMTGDKTEANMSGGTTTSDFWIIKLDASGNILWQNTIGGAQNETLYSVTQTTDGGYIIGGTSYSGISGDKTEANVSGGTLTSDYWIIKLDAAGNIVWQNTIGGTVSDILYDVEQTADAGYIAAGYSYSGISGDKTVVNISGGTVTSDFWILKLNAVGNIEWQRSIGGTGSDFAKDIEQLSDGGYIIGGESTSEISGDKSEPLGGSYDTWIVRIDASGTIIWENTINGESSDGLNSIRQTADGGFIFSGYTSTSEDGDFAEVALFGGEYGIIKLDASGNILWQSAIGGTSFESHSEAELTADGGYILIGYSSSGIGGDKTEGTVGGIQGDYWMVKLSSDICIPTLKYFDNDDDDYGVETPVVTACESPLGYAGVNGDCNDYDLYIHPATTETCNAIDDNCSGAIDEGLAGCIPGPTIQFQNTIGGYYYNNFTSINTTPDGGYIVSGYSSSGIFGDKTEATIGGYDYWIMKLDAGLNITWQKTVGTIKDDYSAELITTVDGGYFLGGYVHTSNAVQDDYKAMKFDAFGNLEWQALFGTVENDELAAVIQTTDGGYLLGGYTRGGISGVKTVVNYGWEDYWIIKINSTGIIEWQKDYGGNNQDILTDIEQTSDGGYLLGGHSVSGISGNKTELNSGLADYWIIKLDNLGNIIWQNDIGGSNWEELYDLEETADGGYILGGQSESNISGDKTEASNGMDDYWILKLNNTGNIIWQQTIGGGKGDYISKAMPAKDGGILVGGSSESDSSKNKTE